MRFIDFMVFYTMANFRRRNSDKSMLESQLIRAGFIASLPASFIIYIAMEIICFFVFRVNIFDGSYLPVLLALWLILDSLVFNYIYINKKRYKYITSLQFKPFKLSTNSGLNIGFLLIIVSLGGVIGVSLVISSLLAK
jgi:hypothetical protein